MTHPTEKDEPLRAAVATAGPRGSKLRDGEEVLASVNALRNWGAGPRYKGWFWTANNEARGIPYENTCDRPAPDEATAKAQAMAYVKQHLKR